MVANQISSVLKQAITTFTCKKEIFRQNLEILKAILDKTTATDVNFPSQFMTDTLWQKSNKAPVTYIDIYDDNLLSLGIFILSPGMKLPLHDHPQMFGLIKVIAGTIKITSYSLHTDKTITIDGKYITHPSNTYPMSVMAEKHDDIVANPKTDICVLEPDRGNIHEIESVDGPAAFIDILSPPYDSVIPNYGPRKCSYYKITQQVGPGVFKLDEILAPSWFWNDTFPYNGPELFKISIKN